VKEGVVRNKIGEKDGPKIEDQNAWDERKELEVYRRVEK
jgi:hypothetical protein